MDSNFLHLSTSGGGRGGGSEGGQGADGPTHGTKRDYPTSSPSNAASNRSRAAASYPRKRAVSACLVCRGRKTKCDNQRPQCGFCMQMGAECVYEAEKLATFDAASLAILDKLSRIEALLDSNVNSGQRQQPNTPASHPSPHTSSSTTSGGPPLASLTPQSDSPKGYKAPAIDDPGTFSVSIDIASGSRVESVLQWPIFGGHFRTGDLLAPVFANGSRDGDEEEDEELENCQEKRRVEAGDVQGHSGRRGVGSCDDGKLVGEIAVLVQRFFRNVHTKNPILDSVVLNGYVSEIQQNGFGWSGKSCLVLLVCALGSISAPYNPRRSSLSMAEPPTAYPSSEISARYFSAAKKRLGIVMSSNKLIAVQCLFLAGIYHMYTMNQFAAWKMFNAASVSCEGYLHRKENAKTSDSPTNVVYPSCSRGEPTRHLEQRIYWSCLKSELELCAQLGTSHSGLNELDYPHAFPSPPREISTSTAFQSSGSFFEQPRSAQSHSQSPTGAHQESRAEDELTWFYYLAEIALRKVELRMSGAFNSPPTSPPNAEDPKPIKTSNLLTSAGEFELQLGLWYDCLPPVLKFPQDPTLPCHDERLQYLRQRYWWNISRVYRPFLYHLIHHPQSAPQSQGSKHSSHTRTIQEYANKGLEIDTNLILSNVMTHRHHGAWLALRAVTANSLVLVASNRAGMVMPSRWREAVTEAKNCLLFWESEVRDARALREVVEEAEGLRSS